MLSVTLYKRKRSTSCNSQFQRVLVEETMPAHRGKRRIAKKRKRRTKKQQGGAIITVPLLLAGLGAAAKAAALGATSGAASYGVQKLMKGKKKTVKRKSIV